MWYSFMLFMTQSQKDDNFLRISLFITECVWSVVGLHDGRSWYRICAWTEELIHCYLQSQQCSYSNFENFVRTRGDGAVEWIQQQIPREPGIVIENISPVCSGLVKVNLCSELVKVSWITWSPSLYVSGLTRYNSPHEIINKTWVFCILFLIVFCARCRLPTTQRRAKIAIVWERIVSLC